MARWLVALAVVLVSRPIDAGGFRIERSHRKVTTSTSVFAPTIEPSLATVALAGSLIARERPGALEVVDRRTGATIASAPLTSNRIQAVLRTADSTVIKTRGDLLSLDRVTGRVRWIQPASSVGNPALHRGEIVDAWVDRAAHRYGLVSRDPRDGRVTGRIDLGATGGWYDLENVVLGADSPDDVLVSAMFGC
jgi:hypothetical protein